MNNDNELLLSNYILNNFRIIEKGKGSYGLYLVKNVTKKPLFNFNNIDEEELVF